MTRLGLTAACLLGLLFPLTTFAQQPPLRWGADEEGGMPYIFPDPKNPGHYQGFEVDLKDLLARELGRQIEWKHYEFASLFKGLDRGDFDFAMNGLEVLPDRLRQYRFTRPYYVYKLQLAVRKGDTRFKSIEELRDRRDVVVGTLEGTAADAVLGELGVNKRTYTGQTELYKELEKGPDLGGLDAVYIDTIIHATYLPRFPGLTLVGEAERPGYYAIALRKEDEKLAADLDAALERLLQKGDLRRVYEKWKIWNIDQDGLLTFTAYPDPEEDEGAANQWPFVRYLPMLLRGAWMTIRIAVLGMAMAVALGLPIALARMYGPRPVRWLAVGYIEFFRGIPVLLLLYFLYYGLADLDKYYGLGGLLVLNAFWAAVIGFGINYAAYEAEIYRAGIGSIPAGQWEAAAALGMRPGLTFRRIILPQALRSILPPMTNDFVALFKDTSVVSIIALVELSKEYQTLSKTSFKYVEIGLVTAGLYLIMSVPLGYLSRYLEARWSEHA